MAPPARIAVFLGDLDRHYLEWHPDHVSFAWLDDDHRRFRFDERIGRWTLRLAMTVDRSADGLSATCRPVSAVLRLVFPWMTFEAIPDGNGSRFRHRINLRLGPLRPLLERTLLRPLRRHMRDESRNLGRLLTAPAVA